MITKSLPNLTCKAKIFVSQSPIYFLSSLLINDQYGYSVVLKLCDEFDMASAMLEYFKKRLLQHINQTIIPVLKDKDEETFLKLFIQQWKNYTILVHFMRKIFSYLDRYHLKNTSSMSLAATALNQFKENCF
jgi:hypothetical protein